jgi:hypothetical protein
MEEKSGLLIDLDEPEDISQESKAENSQENVEEDVQKETS